MKHSVYCPIAPSPPRHHLQLRIRVIQVDLQASGTTGCGQNRSGLRRLFFIGCLEALKDDLSTQPLVSWDEVPAENAEYGHRAENDTGLNPVLVQQQYNYNDSTYKVERLGSDREEERRNLSLIGMSIFVQAETEVYLQQKLEH